MQRAACAPIELRQCHSGLTLFTDRIEKSVPPRKGTRHVLRLIRELLYCQPIGRGTDLSAALDHLNRTSSRRTVVFVISDFQDRGFDSSLRITRRKHDVIPVQITDPREWELPNVGLIRLRDSESGELITVDTSSRRQRFEYREMRRAEQDRLESMFRRLKLQPIKIETGVDYVDPLKRFFHMRETHR
ncbi:MAG: VWA domain-containing protein [Planctomycetota bacterium]